MSAVYLKKILLKNSVADKKCYIYMHSEWNEQQLIKLYMKESSTTHYYEGKVDAKDFEEAAEELEISLDEYLGNLKKVLTTDIGLAGFEIELERENKIMRVNRTIGLEIMYVEIQLKEADKNYDMLDVALQTINNEKTKNEDQVVEKALTNVIGAVEEVLQEKEEWKQKMLSRFLLLLNEKKNKISRLEKELENVNKGKRRTSGAQMDVQYNDEDSITDVQANSSDDDFNAPTQRLTPPTTETHNNNLYAHIKHSSLIE